MGSKVIARSIAQEAGIAVIPASSILSPEEQGEQEALAFAATRLSPHDQSGVRGGRPGHTPGEKRQKLLAGLRMSRSEALISFGNSDIYLEKGIPRPQHVEVQILADELWHGGASGHPQLLHPAASSKAHRNRPGRFGTGPDRRNLRSRGEHGPGRPLFQRRHGGIPGGPDGSFYFLEVNTRIQVEHTVTEMVTGIDIIREQLLIAMGEPISFSQDQVVERGYAIQVRINAEDPKNDFLASPGVVQVYQSSAGHGVRLDGAIYQGYEIPPYYDSLMVKLTVYGYTWQEAVDRLHRALKGFLILGVKTTIPFFPANRARPGFHHAAAGYRYIDDHPHLMEYQEEGTGGG
jgi:pyruvate carboxylase subunit A